MIQVLNLTKTFTDPKRGLVRAVDHISFEVREREIFGLLGPNGAGKTTALRMLSTVMQPTEGTAVLGGYDIVRQPEEVRRQIGFLSGDMGLYHRLTPRETLKFFGELNGIRGDLLKRRLADVFARLRIEEFADTKVDKLLHRHAAARGRRAHAHPGPARPHPRRARLGPRRYPPRALSRNPSWKRATRESAASSSPHT